MLLWMESTMWTQTTTWVGFVLRRPVLHCVTWRLWQLESDSDGPSLIQNTFLSGSSPALDHDDARRDRTSVRVWANVEQDSTVSMVQGLNATTSQHLASHWVNATFQTMRAYHPPMIAAPKPAKGRWIRHQVGVTAQSDNHIQRDHGREHINRLCPLILNEMSVTTFDYPRMSHSSYEGARRKCKPWL